MNTKINMQEFLEKYYWEDDSVILWCSGGPDSMYLLNQILETSFAKNLVICYFNHKTRPETDDEDEYLEKLAWAIWCQFEQAECDFERIKKLHPSRSFEELAREKRYPFFDAVMNIHNSQYVLTAHHLDDRIETCMFNMLRGTKLTGLINMTECHGWILRPLLNIEKTEILEYLETNSLKYFVDETNENTDITRNKIRHEILPKFWEIHPNHKQNVSNLLNYFEELKENIDQQVDTFLWQDKDFTLARFQELTPLIQKEIIREIFYRTNNNSTIWLSEANIAEVLKFISWPNGNTTKEIKNMKLFKKSGKINF